MSFVQEAAASTDAKQLNTPETQAVPQTSGAPNDTTVNTETAEAKPQAAVVPSESESAAKPETELETQANTITVTKSETVTKQVSPTVSPYSFLMWLPLVAAMALWLYLRGRNQAAERARADAMLAAASKKAKKSSRSKDTEFRAEQSSDSISSVSSERSKGNSKKNKKDKLRQKKKQQASSGASVSKVSKLSAASPDSTSGIAAASTNSPTSKIADPSAIASAHQPTTSHLAQDSAASIAQVVTTPAIQPPKAIFEPLRKITATAPVAKPEDIDDDEADDSDYSANRRRRQSPPSQVVTAPAKVTGGRFEKLNVPAANAGLGASSANRWPSEATRATTPVRTSEPLAASRSSVSESKPVAGSSGPITARGLGAFVKVAKPTESVQSASSAETQSETSGS